MRRTSMLLGGVSILAVAIVAMAQQQGGAGQAGGGRFGRDEAGAGLPLDRWQPKRLPAMATGITLDLIRRGDSLFHDKGGCVTCHGPDAFGMPNAGSGLTMGLHFIPAQLGAIDTLITQGLAESLTRSSVAMPPRGAASNLNPDETRAIAAYVWAIAQTADEPWPGGHRTHGQVAGSTDSTRAAGGGQPRR